MAGILYPAQLRYDADFAEEMGYRDHAHKLRGCADELEKLHDFALWIDTWISNPAASYSNAALDGLFGMARDRMAALAILSVPRDLSDGLPHLNRSE